MPYTDIFTDPTTVFTVTKDVNNVQFGIYAEAGSPANSWSIDRTMEEIDGELLSNRNKKVRLTNEINNLQEELATATALENAFTDIRAQAELL